MHPYTSRKNELSVQDECVLWESRIIVPQTGNCTVLEELHDGHPGITTTKILARSFVWWPGIDKDVEEKVKGSQKCQEKQNAPAKAPLHPWEWPRLPWTHIHINYAGPFLGKMFLVVVDLYSKCLEIMIVPSATSQNTTHDPGLCLPHVDFLKSSSLTVEQHLSVQCSKSSLDTM